MVNSYTDYNYDFKTDPILFEDTIDNLNEYLPSSLNEFAIQNLFKIRQPDRLKTRHEYYLDFCKPREDLNPKIAERLELTEDERPKYFNSLWKIYVAANIVDEQLSNSPPGGDKVSNTKYNPGNISIFIDSFKSIKFESKPEEIKDEKLFDNIYELQLFIDYSLNNMDEKIAAKELAKLLNIFSTLHRYTSNSQHKKSRLDEKAQEKSRQESMNSFIVLPILQFINKLLSSNNEYIRFTNEMEKEIEPQRPRQIWKAHMVGNESYPKNLTNRRMFHNCEPDIPITLEDIEDGLIPIAGIEMRNQDLASQLERFQQTDNLSSLSKDFNLTSQYQIFMKLNSYLLSNFNQTIYFEYPLNGGEWKSYNEDDVVFTGASLRYKLFDNSGNTPTNSMQLQLLLMLKAYEGIRRKTSTDEWLKDSNGGYVLDKESYRLMDEGWKPDLFNPFVTSLFKSGFKQKAEFDKLEKITEEETKNQLTKLFPKTANLKVSNYKILNKHSTYKGVKLVINESSDIFKGDSANTSEKVFFKMFDLVNLQNLHSYISSSGIPHHKDEVQKFTESELSILSSLKGHMRSDFIPILEKLKNSYLREITALKRIKKWNSTHGPDEQINSPKLLQYGWAYLELPSEGQTGYSYWGPFICTEYFEFINDNDVRNNPKRVDNMRNQLINLKAAGIKHNDIKDDNICFDEFDQAHFIDYDCSIVDGNRYLENGDSKTANIIFKDIAPKLQSKGVSTSTATSTTTSTPSKTNSNLNNLMFLNSIKVSYPIHQISNETLRFIPDSQLSLIKPLIDESNQDNESFIQKKKYSTSVDERNFLTVFEYKLNDNWILWDYSTGYVFFTGLWKSCGNNKTDIVKLVENFPNLSNVVKRVRGGFLKIQGTWLPFDVVRNLAKNFCFNIRYCLIPIFGEGFPKECLLPSDQNFGKLIDLNSKIQVENAANSMNKKRRSHSISTPMSIDKPNFKKRSKSDVQYKPTITNKIQLLEIEEILKASKSLHDLSNTSKFYPAASSNSNYFFTSNLSSPIRSRSIISNSQIPYGGFIWSWNEENNLIIIGKDEGQQQHQQQQYIPQYVSQDINKYDASIPKNYDGIDTIINAANQLMNFHSGSNQGTHGTQGNGNDDKKGKMDIDGLLS
ncbi:Transcriptional repressor XBP1 [Wickerhamomyces ciferrii]|uniref:Transcriptional repressor XBP1 n=1 Tax=Wickerhamomyces ciferrii (strain ATCC 14091 / BCRC 22168 / CBS 111 / JCM 3599 / NBRC 0793 / NRRL Y-1031 F-60-10) TaxID=1206466 RepID=K0KES5_WICCF|nr:Transcriptional repressor XBP1 [Wickerhamomyces ciferrii]CCH43635.1 Transcriptional repressor XBP1 [Wickerhamomyces ciferrii]